jgi:hypothetical protein
MNASKSFRRLAPRTLDELSTSKPVLPSVIVWLCRGVFSAVAGVFMAPFLPKNMG